MKLHASRLANGLQLAAGRLKGAGGRVSIRVGFRAGSRYEAEGARGLTAFTARGMEQGTENFPSAFAVADAFERVGDGLEILPGREWTSFHASVEHDQLERGVELLGEVCLRPVFSGLESGLNRTRDLWRRPHTSEDRILAAFFADAPLGKDPLGNEEWLGDASREDCRAFHREFFTPDNAVAVAVGDVEPGRFFKAMNRVFGRADAPLPEEEVPAFAGEAPPIPGEYPGIEPALFARGPHALLNPSTSSAFGSSGSLPESVTVAVGFVGEGFRSPWLFPQLALETALADGKASRLWRGLVERQGLSPEVRVSGDRWTDAGVLVLTLTPGPERTRRSVAELLRALRECGETELDAQELARVRLRLARSFDRISESASALSSWICRARLLGYGLPDDPAHLSARARAVSATQILEAARVLFVPERLAGLVEGPIPPVDEGDVRQMLEQGSDRFR